MVVARPLNVPSFGTAAIDGKHEERPSEWATLAFAEGGSNAIATDSTVAGAATTATMAASTTNEGGTVA